MKHKKNYTLLFFTVFFTQFAFSQYYYKDIINAQEAKGMVNRYRENKVKTLTIKNFDYRGEPDDDFYCVKKFNNKYSNSELKINSRGTGASLMTTGYLADGSVSTSNDSSDISVVSIIYTYNAAGMPQKIESSISSKDDDYVTKIVETHLYEYDATNRPEKMTKLINGKDSVFFLFAKDEAGNIGIEKNTTTGEKYFYYYDTRGRLTDIVKNSEYGGGLQPEYIFTYNNSGQVTQMITTGASSGYNTWKYNYENGLRIAEKLYGKDRKLVGSIEYIYK